MSLDRRLLNWGIFLVILGGIPLAVNQGLVPSGTFSRTWQLWPLLLVGAGIGLILSRTRVAFLGGLIMAATAGVILGGLLVGGISLGNIGCAGSGDGPVTLDRSGRFSFQPARVTLEVDCGSLTVAASADDAWHLRTTGSERMTPSVQESDQALTVRSPGGWVIPFTGGNASAWNLTLPTNRLELEAELNAADSRFSLGGMVLARLAISANAAGTRVDLTSATVEALAIETNASDLRLALPAGGTTGTIDANAASVHLCAPAGVRLRLTVGDANISSDNFGARGLTRSGSTWESPNNGGPLVELRLDANAASYTLEGPDDCR